MGAGAVHPFTLGTCEVNNPQKQVFEASFTYIRPLAVHCWLTNDGAKLNKKNKTNK